MAWIDIFNDPSGVNSVLIYGTDISANVYESGVISTYEDLYNFIFGNQLIQWSMVINAGQVGDEYRITLSNLPNADASFPEALAVSNYPFDIETGGVFADWQPTDTGSNLVWPEIIYATPYWNISIHTAYGEYTILIERQEGEEPPVELEYGVGVPAAISSELDHGGEERIHIAFMLPRTQPVQECGTAVFWNFYADMSPPNVSPRYLVSVDGAPSWFIPPAEASSGDTIYVEFEDSGEFFEYTHYTDTYRAVDYTAPGIVTLPDSGKATIYSEDQSQTFCVNYTRQDPPPA